MREYVHVLFPARAMWLTLEMQAARVSCEQDGPQIFHQKAHVETAPEMFNTYVSVLNASQLSSQYQCIFSPVPYKNTNDFFLHKKVFP